MFRRSFLVGLVTAIGCGLARAEPPLHEQTRIAKLITYVESRKDMTFVRNGTEYSCADAARFLRGKFESMGAEVTSARDFIERIASKSSMSGEPYRVKFADGKVMLASEFLGDELKRLEARPG